MGHDCDGAVDARGGDGGGDAPSPPGGVTDQSVERERHEHTAGLRGYRGSDDWSAHFRSRL